MEALQEGDEMIESTKNNVPKVRLAFDDGGMSTKTQFRLSGLHYSFGKDKDWRRWKAGND